MKVSYNLIVGCFFPLLFSTFHSGAQNGDDGWNNRIISTYASDIEVARVSIRFIPSFSTQGNTNFHAYIDPDLPYNGGVPVTDGEFNMNYIRVYEPKGDFKTTQPPQHIALDYSKWREQITYYDGIGRPIQKIDVKGIPNGCDLITPIEYDDIGRQEFEFLQYSLTQGGTNGPGGYRVNFLTEQINFNNYYFQGEGLNARRIKTFDNSPLNRVIENLGPGKDWQQSGTTKPFKFFYDTNDEGEVYLLTVTNENKLSKLGCFDSGKLRKTTIIDENGNSTIEWRDFSDRMIASLSNDGNQWLNTLFVYDDFGKLRYIITPEAYSNLPLGTGTGTFDNETEWIKQLCYYYQYDSRMRLIIKRLPGIECQYFVYNKRNKIVLSQDGNQRLNKQWIFTKYDIYDRPILTGIYIHSNVVDQSEMQSIVDQTTTYFEEFAVSNPIHGYSANAFPKQLSSEDVYTVNYHDNYDFLSHSSNTGDYTFKSDKINFLYGKSNKTIGLITGLKVRAFPHDNLVISDEWLLSVNYFDKYNRIIQTIEDNHFGKKDITSNEINFTGQILATNNTHENLTTIFSHTLLFDFTNTGLISKTISLIANQPQITLNKSVYNDLAQLKRKKLHSSLGEDYIQSIDYQYNIRNWLNEINNVSSIGTDLFASKLEYTSGTHPQFNGNISSITWSSYEFPETKQYQFDYDGISRLISAEFANSNQYSVNIGSYDKNGNILSLARSGELPHGDYGPIDDLTYAYSGNQLMSVNDDPGVDFQNNGFTDNGSFNSIEYLYDANGNSVRDLNKQIESITYNFKNLPQRIDIATGQQQWILYVYDALGRKLQKQTRVDQSIVSTTDYIGSFVYENGQLKYITTPEGRIVQDDEGFKYEYFFKDHLGNNRIIFNEEGDILQDFSYYPFGMTMEGLNFTSDHFQNKNLFNGKELQDDFNLFWYDYKFRFYDQQIGRFHSIDRLSEKFYNWTPYQYCSNNPISKVEIDGLEGLYFHKDLQNSPAWGQVFRVSSNTTSHQNFVRVVEGQKIWDVYYSTYSSQYGSAGWAVPLMSARDYYNKKYMVDFGSTLKPNLSFVGTTLLSNLNDKEMEPLFAGGKHIFVVFINQNLLKYETTSDLSNSSFSILHEENHALKRILGIISTIIEDHDKYYNSPVGYFSPTEEEVRTEEQYKNSQAKKDIDETDKNARKEEVPIKKEVPINEEVPIN